METIPTTEKPAIRSKEEIASIITQWQQSGKNKKQFCQENNLTYMTFIGWTAPEKSALGKKSKSACRTGREKLAAFIPVRAVKTSPEPFAEISLGNSTIILHREVSARYLRELLG